MTTLILFLLAAVFVKFTWSGIDYEQNQKYLYWFIVETPDMTHSLGTPNEWIFKRGFGNGYVSVPKDHPTNGCPYDSYMYEDYEDYQFTPTQEAIENIRVHGGLTYSERSDNGRWVFGFDTAHGGDNKQNCPKEYVEEQCKSLMKQLEAIR